MFDSIDTDGEIENDCDLFNYALNVFKPTKADLERVITKEEQKELCLKHKCRVDIWRWNPVNEYRLAFEEKERYQNWNDKKKLKMLAKSVNMMKSHEFLSDEKIFKIKQKEWEIQKKESILSLDLWAYDRSKKGKLLQGNEVQSQSHFSDNRSNVLDFPVDDIRITRPHERNGAETQSNCSNTMSDILELLVDDIDGPEPHGRQHFECVSTNLYNIDYNNNNSKQTIINMKNTPPSNPCEREMDTIFNFIDSDDENTVSSKICETDHKPQGKKLDTVPNGCFHINLGVSFQPGQSKLVAQLDDTDALVDDLLNVNTESMSIDTQLLTQSQLTQFVDKYQQLSPGEPPNYKNFNNEVPLNSTQAQSFGLT